jgi:NADPH:quinone reductase-like Zn-dependent oxidoreductase
LKYVKEKFEPDHVINYIRTPNWAAEANKITNGHGVDLIFENGGSGTIKQSMDAIAPGGTIAVIGFLSRASQADMPDVAMMAVIKGCIVRGILVGPKQYLDDLTTFVANKHIELPVEKTFGFSIDEVHAAFEYLKGGGHVGKVCISVS